MKRSFVIALFIAVSLMVVSSAIADVDLVSGRNKTDIGNVGVVIGAGPLSVTVTLTLADTTNWRFAPVGSEITHVDVSTVDPRVDIDQIPQNKNHNPKPSEFDYVAGVAINLENPDLGLTPGQTLYIAVHAKVERRTVVDGVDVWVDESAWGLGTEFNPESAGKKNRNWAMFFEIIPITP
jgi:hypothetical protein